MQKNSVPWWAAVGTYNANSWQQLRPGGTYLIVQRFCRQRLRAGALIAPRPGGAEHTAALDSAFLEGDAQKPKR